MDVRTGETGTAGEAAGVAGPGKGKGPGRGPDDAGTPPVEGVRTDSGVSRRGLMLAIFAISAAGLILEVAYTRVVSYKLWYYYTYLVIGLALLGIGSGATAVVLSARLRGAATRSILAVSSTLGAVSVVVGYWVVAKVPIDTVALWDYGTGRSIRSLAALLLICLVLFATFISIGVMVATLLGRAGAELPRLYFADLLGAGIGCLVVVYLITLLTPPGTIALAALLLAATGVAFAATRAPVGDPEGRARAAAHHPVVRAVALLVAVLAALTVVFHHVLPDPVPEASKVKPPPNGWESSDWGPVFRVDVGPVPFHDDQKWLIHDGIYGSAIHEFNGDLSTLAHFETDPRIWPFKTLGTPPDNQLIIGSAGGNEIQASLYNGTRKIHAVELNPVTVGLVTGRYRNYVGDLTSYPQVDLHQGDGRSYLARSSDRYDLVWFVAPDSYSANNAASSGAFVLSESYLYTADMITETLDHLSDRGISVAQFGEWDFEHRPNRTMRYVNTAREALARVGVDDPSRHLIVATSGDPLSGGLSTIMVKRTPFTDEEVARFQKSISSVENGRLIYAPGLPPADSPVAKVPTAGPQELDKLLADYPYDVHAITDDGPFFWHFAPFGSVVRDIGHPINPKDFEDSIGERVLLLLLGIASLFAVTFLLLPFVVIRKQWRTLPAKLPSAVYFAALGLGFMFFEVTMIQKFTEYLGFPTYSLTVTLASILVFTGLGALLSGRLRVEPRKLLGWLLVALLVLTAVYRFALAPLTDATLDAPFAVRVFITFAVLAPLGLCLGMFMPVGLQAVAGLSGHPDEYVAWGWAINGVFSVIGSVLTTILSMTFGFRTVQGLALGLYVVAGLAFLALYRHRPVELPA